jgi:hypothetical protein
MLLSIGLIIGGLSGEFVLRGTNSSEALVAVGVLWLIFDISQFIPFKKKTEDTVSKKQRESRSPRKGRSPLRFVLCGVYMAANLVCAFLLFDELGVPGGTGMELLAILGNAISILGVVIVLFKKQFGIIVALAGSAVSIAFTILSGIFIIGAIPHFDTGGFVGFMLIGLLPGFILWLQMKITAHRNPHGGDHEGNTTA